MGTLIQDIRYGFRMLTKNPGFTAVAVVTLALGIGANTAIFTVVNAVLLRPLPYRDPGRLVWITEFFPKTNDTMMPHPDFFEWREQSRTFESLAASRGGGQFNLSAGGEPERVHGLSITNNFFSMLGVQPAMGRAFLPEEDQPGGPPVVVLSQSLWMRRFGGNAGLLGKSVTLDGSSYTVVGVMPPGFRFPGSGEPDLYVPFRLSGKFDASRPIFFPDVIGRLRPGVSLEQAKSDLTILIRRTHPRYPRWFTPMSAGVEVRVIPLHTELVGDFRKVVLILFVAVAFILLIACANVANLQLANEARRQREIAVRAALGAGRFRLVRQLLTESLLLAGLGACAAFFVASWGLDFLRVLGSKTIPHLAGIRIDPRVLMFTAVVAVVSGILFGLVPGLVAGKPDLNEALKEGGTRAIAGPGRSRLRAALVVSELALSLVLLAGAGLLIRSLSRLTAIQPGFNPDNVLTLRIALPLSKYKQPAQQAAFFQQLLERVQALPGVLSVAAADSLPLVGFYMAQRVAIEGQPPPPPDQPASAPTQVVTPAYFATLGIPLIKGRPFSDYDATGAPKVAIVNQAFARRYFPNEQPIGRRIRLGADDAEWVSIVGVVGNVRQLGPEKEASPDVFLPFLQNPDGYVALVARSTSDPLALVPAIRLAVLALDKDQPVYEVTTMEQMLADSLASRRFNVFLLGLFAAVALILAAVGVAGVTSYSLTQRTHEIGIRLALGATPQDVLRLIVSQGIGMTLAGIGLGLAGAWGLTRFLSSLLFGVRPTDWATFGSVSLLLAAAAMLASYIPARRATKVDPMVALRYE